MLTLRAKIEDGSDEREGLIHQARTIIENDHSITVERHGFVNITAQVPRERAEQVRQQLAVIGILNVTVSEPTP